MKASVAQAKAHFGEMVETARSGETVIVTRRGEPIVAVVPVPRNREERERFLLAHSPSFRKALAVSRESGELIPHGDLWRRVEKRRRPPSARKVGVRKS